MFIFFIRTPEKFNMKKRTLTTNLIFAVLVFLTNGSVVGIVVAAGPSFDCSKAAGICGFDEGRHARRPLRTASPRSPKIL